MTVVRIPVHEATATNTAVTLLELGHSSLTVPNGLYLIYCWCASVAETAKRDLFPLAGKLFSLVFDQQQTDETDDVGVGGDDAVDHRPRLLWSCYFNQIRANDTSETKVKQVYATNSPSDELDYAQVIEEVSIRFRHFLSIQQRVVRKFSFILTTGNTRCDRVGSRYTSRVSIRDY